MRKRLLEPVRLARRARDRRCGRWTAGSPAAAPRPRTARAERAASRLQQPVARISTGMKSQKKSETKHASRAPAQQTHSSATTPEKLWCIEDDR